MSVSSAEHVPAKPVQPRLIPHGVLIPFALVTALFFLWGVPNNLNDVLIRQFMKSFALSRFQAGLVQSAFYMGYFLLATPAALLMRRFGNKSGFVTGGCCFSAREPFLFWPGPSSGAIHISSQRCLSLPVGLLFETASIDSSHISAILNPPGAVQFALGVQSTRPHHRRTDGHRVYFSGIELSGSQVAAMQASNTYTAYLRAETMRVVAPYMVLGSRHHYLGGTDRAHAFSRRGR